jgi:heme/copper-type cytochrome/quinol oxidase subunit 2
MALSLPPQLPDALYWAAVACCVVAQVAIVRSVLRAGARSEAPDDATERPVPHSRRAVELVWVLVPAIGLAAVLVVTWRTMHPRI